MKYNYLILMLVAAVSFSSCKKDLDLQPTDSFNEANAFLTINDIQLGTNAAHGRYGAFLNDIYISALASDEGKLGADNAGQGAFTYRLQYTSNSTSGGDVTGAYPSYYSLIDQVNRVLPAIPNVTATDAEEPLRDQLKGQLLALRALGHFNLMRLYSDNYDPADPLGVPIMLTSNPLGQPARSSMGDVMAQVEADLAEAKTLTADVPFSDLVMNKYSIAGYQARVALYKGDYQAAIDYATEVIDANIAPLVTGSAFAGIWVDVNQNELLHRVRLETSTALGGLFTTTGDNIYLAPSDKLIQSYDQANDIRFPVYIGRDSDGNYYVNKYYESPRGGRIVDIKALRIAEMYLIRAEAYAKIAAPNLTLGAADLNLLRSMRIDGYVDEAFATPSALINAVLLERFKELAFEGHRFWDLKRNNLPVERLASDASDAWRTLPAGDYRFVLPIPSGELLANPSTVQNPGY